MVIEGARKSSSNPEPRATRDEIADTESRLHRRPPHVISVSVDAVADHALRARQEAAGATELRCDACDGIIEGEPAGSGLYVWYRGEEVRFEEPALCVQCATAIGVTALSAWNVEEEEG